MAAFAISSGNLNLMSSSIRILKTVDLPAENFKKDQLIFKEGDVGETFFIVRRGAVAIVKDFGKPNAVKIATVKAGQVLGELSIFDHQFRSATAVALSDVDVTRVPGRSLTFQLEQCPGWFRAVILDLVERLRLANTQLVQLGRTNPQAHSSLKETATSETDSDPKE